MRNKRVRIKKKTQVLREAFGADEVLPQPETAQASAEEVVRRMLMGKEDRISFEMFVGLMQEWKRIKNGSISPPSAKMNNHQSPLLEMKKRLTWAQFVLVVLIWSVLEHESSKIISTEFVRISFVSELEQNERIVDLTDSNNQACSISVIESDDSEMPDGEGAYRRQRLRRRRRPRALDMLLKTSSIGSEAANAHEHSFISLKNHCWPALDNDPRSLKLLQKQCDEMTRKLCARLPTKSSSWKKWALIKSNSKSSLELTLTWQMIMRRWKLKMIYTAWGVGSATRDLPQQLMIIKCRSRTLAVHFTSLWCRR